MKTVDGRWQTVRIPITIVVAGALIASTLLMAFRWQTFVVQSYVYQIDRWTGRAIICDVSMQLAYADRRRTDPICWVTLLSE